MSDAIFPSLNGRSLGIEKTPEFNTILQTSVTKLDRAISLTPYPVWTFSLGYAWLQDEQEATDDIQQIIGFFLNRQGKYDTFLYLDERDNACSLQEFGEGDGSTVKFQLVRSWGDFVEPVSVASAPTIYINGVATTAFSWTTSGVITFTTAPASGAALTWSGTYYFRCRFTDDKLTYKEIVEALWEAPTVLFKSVINSE